MKEEKGTSNSKQYRKSNSRKKKNQFELNLEIEQFIKEKDKKKQTYSKSDIDYIQQYEGAGGLASKGAKGSGLLHEFYTPDYICDYLYKFALKYGYDGGTILEPSIATGRIIEPFKDKSKIVGFEINPVTKRICEITYPEATIYNNYFETAFLDPPRFRIKLKNKVTWLKEYPFSLVIGNPPYGIYQNLYSAYFAKPKFKQIEQFFMYQGLRMLKSGGLLIYVTSSNFMRNWTTYTEAKEHIFSIADFVDAYRLPAIFKNSDVPTDILIFRKK